MLINKVVIIKKVKKVKKKVEASEMLCFSFRKNDEMIIIFYFIPSEKKQK